MITGSNWEVVEVSEVGEVSVILYSFQCCYLPRAAIVIARK